MLHKKAWYVSIFGPSLSAHDFSTKDRKKYLVDSTVRNRLHAYLVGVCENHGAAAMKIGGVADHVHILCRMTKTVSISDFVRELKRDSSKWVKEQDRELASFAWQTGYGAFSVSPSHVEPLVQYISKQESHHREESYQEEFRRLCKKYGAPIDERYAWG